LARLVIKMRSDCNIVNSSKLTQIVALLASPFQIYDCCQNRDTAYQSIQQGVFLNAVRLSNSPPNLSYEMASLSVLVESSYQRQLYLRQLYLRQLYLRQLYLRQLYLRQLYLRQLYLLENSVLEPANDACVLNVCLNLYMSHSTFYSLLQFTDFLSLSVCPLCPIFLRSELL